jgi:hypothetical protein
MADYSNAQSKCLEIIRQKQFMKYLEQGALETPTRKDHTRLSPVR